MRSVGLNPLLFDEVREAKLLQDDLRSAGVGIDLEEAISLLFVARRKYNRFDLFSPGETFQSRLTPWLTNFEAEDRATAMEVVRNLTYVSVGEMRALAVGALDSLVAGFAGAPEALDSTSWNALIDRTGPKVIHALRRTLFVAASDDVLFDFFRRNAQKRCAELSRENFVEYYKFHGSAQPRADKFDRVVLLDQLCASGTSFLREEDGDWAGKLETFERLWPSYRELQVVYSPYLMTKVANQRLVKRLPSWRTARGVGEVAIRPVLLLPVAPCMSSDGGQTVDPKLPVSALCMKYHNRFVDDEHTRKGGPTPYGFGQAGLTLVLNSNVPNNSLPIIWHDYNGWIPLFPRVSHHRAAV